MLLLEEAETNIFAKKILKKFQSTAKKIQTNSFYNIWKRREMATFNHLLLMLKRIQANQFAFYHWKWQIEVFKFSKVFRGYKSKPIPINSPKCQAKLKQDA